jgi:hypothetical protein
LIIYGSLRKKEVVGKEADKDCALWTADAEYATPPVDVCVRHGDMSLPKSASEEHPIQISALG